ncbi:type II toxin-antitoxin system CcdA family antitoxin [Prosthecomicrobium pneumaticum]|uniref:Post-segregation antitoxin (Ccd killing protein) n=1 Tax=Prosthecomicrobium pneumaticum TaxID=81895 RepID=A0A7W9FQH6_9HYPH|nr:type II toxin-antitoxin system CcdA family antitoxin [Prosthecomicrobium pneumaticum]MBB5754990.1 post-segregation antitoxin (ccd killing protein) [Prosthecomicrobium pneumaticum]
MTDILDTRVDEQLVAEAKRLGIDVGSVTNRALRDQIDRVRFREAWRTANREAIAEANAELARNGLWSDGLRTF